MISQPTYQAAQAVAKAVEAHFAQHFSQATQKVDASTLAPIPSVDVIESMIDAAFWASLRREEGNSPKISLAFLPAPLAGNALIFENRLLLTPSDSDKISPRR